MSPKRQRSERIQTSDESDASGPTSRTKRARRSQGGSESDEEKPVKVHIVQAKLDSNGIKALYRLAEDSLHDSEEPGTAFHMQLCSEAERADIIITAVRMKARLVRHVDWSIAKQKAIVTPDWLKDSVNARRPLPCGDYAALPELEEETAQNCSDHHECNASSHPGSPSRKPLSSSGSNSLQASSVSGPSNAPPAVRPTAPSVFKNWRTRYSCQRVCPLICPNQALAHELAVLCRDRELEGLSRNALAYERAVGMIKSYPNLITRETFKSDIANLPGMGEKIGSKVQEYIKLGHIKETQITLASERYQALSTFTSIYGIGPSKARQYYDMGLRDISDLERYFDVTPGVSIKTPAEVDAALTQIEEQDMFMPNGKRIKGKEKVPDITIPVALALRDELEQAIPRSEVEEIREIVMKELEEIQPGCVNTIVGGYRRGKPMSNDADIVISHPDPIRGKEIIPGLCKILTAKLYKKGLVTHVMHLSGFHSYDALRTEHWDSLEKALTVFKLPPADGVERIHRRLDIIFALPESYWTAVIGWTGSKMFERDLRLWAKQEKGMKFDSIGLTRRHDTKRYLPKSEKEVFDILGLPWIDPTMRNADA